jgi:hypothetical protein
VGTLAAREGLKKKEGDRQIVALLKKNSAWVTCSTSQAFLWWKGPWYKRQKLLF